MKCLNCNTEADLIEWSIFGGMHQQCQTTTLRREHNGKYKRRIRV